MKAWYVAKTKPAKERSVEACLSRNWGIEVFSPLIYRPSSRHLAFEPLFPTYLFCRVDIRSRAWPSIRWIPGLCYFLGAGEQLVPVSDELITQIKQRVSSWNMDGYIPHFTPGERVVVIGGPFSGVEGIFHQYSSARKRCQVLLQVLGQQNKVELPVVTLRVQHCHKRLSLAT